MQRYVYLVYANPEPIIYAVYTKKKNAVEYALGLVKWRRDKANEKEYEFSTYHVISEDRRYPDSENDKREKLIYYTCLKIKDGLKFMSDDNCIIKVVRRMISK